LTSSECVIYTEQVGEAHEAWITCLEKGREPALEVAKEEVAQTKGS